MKIDNLKIKLVRWKHDPLANGNLPLWLYFSHDADVKYLATGYGTPGDHWDEKAKKLKDTHPDYFEVIAKANDLIEKVKFEVRLAERSHEVNITLSEIKKRINSGDEIPALHRGYHLAPVVPQPNPTLVKPQPTTKILEYFAQIIAEEERNENPGGADVFKGARSIIRRFLGGDQKDIYFTDFGEKKCKDLEAFLRHKLRLKETSISLYLRTFYRVWNLAGENGHHPDDNKAHPSNFTKFRAYKKVRTKKRALDLDVFNALAKLHFPYESRLFRSLNYILFSCYARGMNGNDMCKLKRSQIVGKQITYIRSKTRRTGKELSFELHPKALRIASLFKMYPLQSDDDYVFPILMSQHDTARKDDQRVESITKDINEDLKVFAEKIKYSGNLTSYVFRHSFATHCEQAGVETKYITEALGHEREEQTRIYLGEISDWRVAKSVNRAIKTGVASNEFPSSSI